MYFLPESPRWLVRHGELLAPARYCLHPRTSDVDAELKEIEQSFAQSQEHGNWRDLFSPTLRPALIVGIGLAIFQQITGINTVIYYAPLIIQSAGVSSASGDPGDRRHRRRQRRHDHRLDVAHRPHRPQAAASHWHCGNDRDVGRFAGLSIPPLAPKHFLGLP